MKNKKNWECDQLYALKNIKTSCPHKRRRWIQRQVLSGARLQDDIHMASWRPCRRGRDRGGASEHGDAVAGVEAGSKPCGASPGSGVGPVSGERLPLRSTTGLSGSGGSLCGRRRARIDHPTGTGATRRKLSVQGNDADEDGGSPTRAYHSDSETLNRRIVVNAGERYTGPSVLRLSQMGGLHQQDSPNRQSSSPECGCSPVAAAPIMVPTGMVPAQLKRLSLHGERSSTSLYLAGCGSGLTGPSVSGLLGAEDKSPSLQNLPANPLLLGSHAAVYGHHPLHHHGAQYGQPHAASACPTNTTTSSRVSCCSSTTDNNFYLHTGGHNNVTAYSSSSDDYHESQGVAGSSSSPYSSWVCSGALQQQPPPPPRQFPPQQHQQGGFYQQHLQQQHMQQQLHHSHQQQHHHMLLGAAGDSGGAQQPLCNEDLSAYMDLMIHIPRMHL